MGWNHRILKRRLKTPSGKRETYYSVREVYYDSPKNPDCPTSYTAEDIDVGSDTLEGVRWQLIMMLAATYKPCVVLRGEKIMEEKKRK
jgi:hypothetical protein